MYRRLRELYNLSTTWKDYDPFLSQKNAAFKGAFGAVFELAHKFSKLLDVQTEEENQILFHELMQVCLWGNAHDLSLLTNMNNDDIRNLQATGKEKLEEQEKNIVVNDIDKVWSHVKGLKNARIDFVLDNSGEYQSRCVHASGVATHELTCRLRL
jgi:damage-control phosphatase, subfamily III